MLEMMHSVGNTEEGYTPGTKYVYITDPEWIAPFKCTVIVSIYGAGGGAGGARSNGRYLGGAGGNGDRQIVTTNVRRGDVLSYTGGGGGYGGGQWNNGGDGLDIIMSLNDVILATVPAGKGGQYSNDYQGAKGANAGNGQGSRGGAGVYRGSGKPGENGYVLLQW